MGIKLAIVIGVSDYTHAPKLLACDGDVALVFAILASSLKYDDTLVLKKDPQSADANSQLAAFFRKHEGKSIEEVFFYYTGHGDRRADDFHYLFADYDTKRPNQTSLSNTDLDAMLRSVKANVVIKIVDACFSGTEYVKANDDVEKIFEKSKEKFQKAYFFFSSSSAEKSRANNEHSYFTRSFADAVLARHGADILYRDISAFIADDVEVKKRQTPFFVTQANQTEIFISVTDDVRDAILAAVKPLSHVPIGTKESTAEIAPAPASLVSRVRERSKAFSTETEAQEALSAFLSEAEGYTWSSPLAELFTATVSKLDDYSNITGMAGIARWLAEEGKQTFAEVITGEEDYEARERVEIDDEFGFANPFRKRYSYQTVTRTREVPKDIRLTAPSPFKAITITFAPKELALAWYKGFIVVVFSKETLFAFYKREREVEKNWDARRTLSNSKWKIKTTPLKEKEAARKLSRSIFDEFRSEIIAEVEQQFEASAVAKS